MLVTLILAVALAAALVGMAAGSFLGRLAAARDHGTTTYGLLIATSFVPIVVHSRRVTDQALRWANRYPTISDLEKVLQQFLVTTVLLTVCFVVATLLLARGYQAYASLAPLAASVVYHLTTFACLREAMGSQSPIRAEMSIWLFIASGAISIFLLAFSGAGKIRARPTPPSSSGA